MIEFKQISAHDYDSSTISHLRWRIFSLSWTWTDTESFPNSTMFQWIKQAISNINLSWTFYFQSMEWEFTLHKWDSEIALSSWFKRYLKLREYTEEWWYWTEYSYIKPEFYEWWTNIFTIRWNTLIVDEVLQDITFRMDYNWHPEIPENELSASLIPIQYEAAIIHYVIALMKFEDWQMSDWHKFMWDYERLLVKMEYDSFRRSIRPTLWFTMTKVI